MKDIAASVLARLKKRAKEKGLSYQMCLQLFCQEELLRRLSMSQYKDNFVLKGGLFIYTLTEFESRATQDIDFLMLQLTNDIDRIKSIMDELCQISSTNDYITLKVMDAKNITLDREYPGITLKFVGQIKQARITFSVDIGINDVIVPGSVMRTLKTQLADFEEPEILTYSLESTIAEKFDAILKRMESTSRMKDFFDIYYLSSLFDFEGYKLQKAIWKTIQNRKTPYENKSFERISEFRDSAFLLGQWKRYQPSIQMKLPEFSIVIERLKQFLEPVFNAIVLESQFLMSWSAAQQTWNL